MGVIKPELSTAPLTLPTSRHELPSTGVSSVFGDHSEKTEESILDFLKITPTGCSKPDRVQSSEYTKLYSQECIRSF
jgi:hypothetical protein